MLADHLGAPSSKAFSGATRSGTLVRPSVPARDIASAVAGRSRLCAGRRAHVLRCPECAGSDNPPWPGCGHSMSRARKAQPCRPRQSCARPFGVCARALQVCRRMSPGEDQLRCTGQPPLQVRSARPLCLECCTERIAAPEVRRWHPAVLGHPPLCVRRQRFAGLNGYTRGVGSPCRGHHAATYCTMLHRSTQCSPLLQ